MTVAVLFLLLGLLLGLAAGYLLARDRRSSPDTDLTRLAYERDRDATAQQDALSALVGPMSAALERVQAQLSRTERDRLQAAAALDEHLAGMRSSAETLRTETAQLVTALRAPQIRGRWGELQLERVIESAGMVEHIDYQTQPSSSDEEDGTLRPDLVVRLVGGKSVVVDSKVAINGYLEAMEATDERARNARLAAHARQLRAHVDALSAKTYWARFAPTPEFVVLFVPADVFLDAALREDPALLEYAFDRNLVLATPSTLVALLRTVAYTWRQDALARNTAEVSALGRDLYQRLTTMSGHLDKVGRSLSAAVGAFNSGVGTLESRVLVSARRLADLSVVDPHVDGLLAGPDQVERTTRSPTLPVQLD